MHTNNSECRILTIKEFAEYLKVTEWTSYCLAATKNIPAFKAGGIWRFRTAGIDGWIAAKSKKSDAK
ncbi:MAG: helix-turn-helix domain-containing protein [Betaproteobacteria bacterium]|nr:helix-turn-helix domain-containing protein [Betaproteobacteria bacterium]